MATQTEVLDWLRTNIRPILEIAGKDAPGLAVKVDPVGPFIHRDDHFSQRFVAQFDHGDDPARSFADIENLRFLGFAATGTKEVTVHGVVTGTALPGPRSESDVRDKVVVFWDRLDAMYQIGVRASGRPILQSSN